MAIEAYPRRAMHGTEFATLGFELARVTRGRCICDVSIRPSIGRGMRGMSFGRYRHQSTVGSWGPRKALRLACRAIDKNDRRGARVISHAHGQTGVYFELWRSKAPILPFRRIFEQWYVETNPIDQFLPDPKFNRESTDDTRRRSRFVQRNCTHRAEGGSSFPNFDVEHPLLGRGNTGWIGRIASSWRIRE